MVWKGPRDATPEELRGDCYGRSGERKGALRGVSTMGSARRSEPFFRGEDATWLKDLRRVAAFRGLPPSSIGEEDFLALIHISVGQTGHRFQVVRAISIVSGFRRFWGYVCTYRALSQSNRQGSIDCVIVSMDDVLSLLVYSAIARCLGAKSVFISVSYTHLDVYKRQGCPWQAWRCICRLSFLRRFMTFSCGFLLVYSR